MWLASVWTARDYEAKKKGTKVRDRNITAINFMRRWRKRIGDRQLGQSGTNIREEQKSNNDKTS
jgi:hypothetical protein